MPKPAQNRALGETDDQFAARQKAIVEAQEKVWQNRKADILADKSPTRRAQNFKKIMTQVESNVSKRMDADLRRKKAQGNRAQIERELAGKG